jgi:hypothetical protein
MSISGQVPSTATMKGYEMIVLVNGLLFLAVGGLALANGVFIRHQGSECASDNRTQCDRQVAVGETTVRVAPFLLAVGAGLLGLAVSLILYRRWYRPSRPEPDEGPGYP